MKIQFTVDIDEGQFPFVIDTERLPQSVGNKEVSLNNFEILKEPPELDIFNLKKGDLLKCISNHDNNWGGCDSAKENLIVGCEYAIEKVEIHSWHTKISLRGKPRLVFNSVHFDLVDR